MFFTMVSANKCDSDAMCSICLTSFEKTMTSNRYLKKLKCGHIFHPCCIDKWIDRKQNCPCCRKQMQTIVAPLKDLLNNVEYDDIPFVQRRVMRRRMNENIPRRMVEYADLFV